MYNIYIQFLETVFLKMAKEIKTTILIIYKMLFTKMYKHTHFSILRHPNIFALEIIYSIYYLLFTLNMLCVKLFCHIIDA